MVWRGAGSDVDVDGDGLSHSIEPAGADAVVPGEGHVDDASDDACGCIDLEGSGESRGDLEVAVGFMALDDGGELGADHGVDQRRRERERRNVHGGEINGRQANLRHDEDVLGFLDPGLLQDESVCVVSPHIVHGVEAQGLL